MSRSAATRFFADQRLPGRRGVMRTRKYWSSNLSSCPSIQPQQSATSIASPLLIVASTALAFESLSQNPFDARGSPARYASRSCAVLNARIGSLFLLEVGIATEDGSVGEVIGGAEEGGAFDRGVGCEHRERTGIVIGAELVRPVAVADEAFPQAGLVPVHLADVENQAVFREHFGLGLGAALVVRVVSAGEAPTAGPAGSGVVDHRSHVGVRQAGALGEGHAGEAVPRQRQPGWQEGERLEGHQFEARCPLED